MLCCKEKNGGNIFMFINTQKEKCNIDEMRAMLANSNYIKLIDNTDTIIEGSINEIGDRHIVVDDIGAFGDMIAVNFADIKNILRLSYIAGE